MYEDCSTGRWRDEAKRRLAISLHHEPMGDVVGNEAGLGTVEKLLSGEIQEFEGNISGPSNCLAGWKKGV
ncbi:hypothetical protein H920_20441 [Fukomys damarensis]|uniref:Uncharacterized protein n=1 Tax=Fukomys damarensis TaxID=885580 RepID=A0A091CLE9_FUKDA|nr:hypothetical protein H920_20441 [Fukomys damarensis]